MKKIARQKNEEGFSLIELMVVVAILGILATIAIPNFQRFQARAKQKEGQALLTSYYQAAKATHAEFTYYYCNFVAIGYKPEGELGYRVVTSDDGANNPPAGNPNDDACVTTAAGTCGAYQVWTEAPSATTVPSAATTAVACSRNAFLAYSISDLNNPTTSDEWSIDQDRALTPVQFGIPQ